MDSERTPVVTDPHDGDKDRAKTTEVILTRFDTLTARAPAGIVDSAPGKAGLPQTPTETGPLPAEVREPRRQPHPRTRTTDLGDRVFGAVTTGFGALVIALMLAMLGVLITQGRESIARFGLGFVTSGTWDAIHDKYGAGPAILGTIYTSLLALLVAAPIGILVAVFLVEMAPRQIRFSLGFLVELLAAVPSIVFGLWALVVLVPLVAQHVEPWFLNHWGNFAMFSGSPTGLSYFTAALILAIMILPTITSISRDVMLAVPNSQRDAMLALGATRWETTWKVIVPYARSGIIGAVVLALGRAIGETMAVQMVIGNSLNFNISVFSPGLTMPATLVNQFAEASTPLFRSALIEVALILMLVTILLNAAARLLVFRVTGPGA